MAGFLDQFRKKVVESVWKEKDDQPHKELNDKIALGVLLWEVAQADAKFLPQEEAKIRQVLKDYAHITDVEMDVVMESIQEASREKIDLYSFTQEVSQDLPYPVKQAITENLFRVACADGDLDHDEHELIRKIAGLLRLDHKDFIEAKIKVKKEFGLKTA